MHRILKEFSFNDKSLIYIQKISLKYQYKIGLVKYVKYYINYLKNY